MFDVYGTIYCITNLQNGKRYVGLTTQEINLRFNQHASMAKTGSTYPIHCAIRKYGRDSFFAEIIDMANTKDELEEKEVFWINELKSKSPNGYNIADGGSSGKLSAASIEKMKETKHSQPPKGKFKGITHKQNSYYASISIDGKQIHLGIYKTPEEAARAYDNGVDKYRSGKGYKNFPVSDAQ